MVHTADAAPDKAFIRSNGLAAKPFTEFGRLAQSWFEVAYLQPRQGGLYPVHNG
jgi:hypothetical protein